jgi:hypothetical protein
VRTGGLVFLRLRDLTEPSSGQKVLLEQCAFLFSPTPVLSQTYR